MAKRRKNNEPMKSGTKMALVITVVAIATGLTIKAVRAVKRNQAVEGASST